jgi:hypothetical protein
MDFPKTQPIGATGMAWYRKEDYPALLKIFTDRHLLPKTFEEWEKKAETGHKKLLTDGFIVIKSYIDPKTFPAWCAAQSLNVNADARMKFASMEAARALARIQQSGDAGCA